MRTFWYFTIKHVANYILMHSYLSSMLLKIISAFYQALSALSNIIIHFLPWPEINKEKIYWYV